MENKKPKIDRGLRYPIVVDESNTFPSSGLTQSNGYFLPITSSSNMSK